MHGAGSKGAPEERCLLGWTYVARGSALLALPIEPPGKDQPRCGAAERARPRTRLPTARFGTTVSTRGRGGYRGTALGEL